MTKRSHNRPKARKPKGLAESFEAKALKLKALRERYRIHAIGQVKKRAIAARKIIEKRQAVLASWGFYGTPEWRELRLRVLKRYGRKCMACKKEHGVMDVDHIKPRSKYPELELDFFNLQVLCRDCNMAKSNTHETDWRTKKYRS